MKRLVLIFFIGLLCHADAQETTGYKPPSSNPTRLYAFNGFLYFVADDGIRGDELWRLKSGLFEMELVADVTPGRRGSKIDWFCGAGDTLWFRATDEQGNGELWASDGLPGGKTERVWRSAEREYREGVLSILDEMDGRLLFTIGPPRASGQLMVCEGPQRLVRPLTSVDRPGDAIVSNVLTHGRYRGALYFGAWSSAGICGLFRSDGTPEGTHCIYALPVEPVIGVAHDEWGFTFVAETVEQGIELWFSHGDSSSTHILKDIFEGPESSYPENLSLAPPHIPGGHPIVYFSATDPDAGRELWQTDGTSEGTILVQDIVPGKTGSSPYHIKTSLRGIFLIATTPEYGLELWAAPAKDKGGYALLQLMPEGHTGPESSVPYAPCLDANGMLYYSQRGTQGEELWYTSPLPNTTRLLQDINPRGDAEPYWTTRVDEWVYFSAFDPLHGRELWGVHSGTDKPILIKDLNTDESVNPSSSPAEFASLGDVLLLAANDIEHGNELWASDGTEAGTVLLLDIAAGPPSSNPSQITAVGGLAYFRAESLSHGSELWSTDGTTEGTVLVGDVYVGEFGSEPDYLTACGDALFYVATRPQEGRELWSVSEGRQPFNVRNIFGGPESSNPRNLFAWKGMVYFQADDGVHGEELWRSDGTEAGTVMVRDIVSEPFEPVNVSRLFSAGDRLFVAGFNPRYGRELWQLDLLDGGLRLVKDIAPPDLLDMRAKK